MNIQKITNELKRKYSKKTIIVQDREGYQEIVVELEPTSDHPEKSLALAIVGKSKPHYHKGTTEVYECIKGILNVSVAGVEHILGEGENITIKPGIVHFAYGDEVWFKTYSIPGWTIADHLFPNE